MYYNVIIKKYYNGIYVWINFKVSFDIYSTNVPHVLNLCTEYISELFETRNNVLYFLFLCVFMTNSLCMRTNNLIKMVDFYESKCIIW